jgi:Fur family ferric uptake transcriptional regulator
VDAELESAARGRLREAGMRITRPRLAVAAALDALGGHRTADEVHAYLGSTGSTTGDDLPRTSVYNALAALCAAGVAMPADVGAGAAAYELATHWHHHFVCRSCGSVSDVDCIVGEKPCLTPEGDFGSVDEAQIIFRGVCRACADKAAMTIAADPVAV